MLKSWGTDQRRSPPASVSCAVTPGWRPLPKNEPRPQPLDTRPPSWIKGRARVHWRRVAPMLVRMGVVAESDRDTLAAMLNAWAEYLDLEDYVQKHGRNNSIGARWRVR